MISQDALVSVKPETRKPTPEPHSPSSDLLTVDEVAGVLRINRKTLFRAIKAGQIPGVIRIGRLLRIHQPTLVRWAASSMGPGLKVKS